MPGKRVQFDDETWQAIDAVARGKGKTFQQLADEAFKDLLKKHRQPVGLKAALKQASVARQSPAPKGSIAKPDELPAHLPAEIPRVVLVIGLDDDPDRAIQRAEADGRRGARPSDADHADGELCRNLCHGSAEMLLHLGSSCYVLA